MAKLSPAGQAFARFLRGFIDGPLKEFRFAGQSTLLPGIQRGMESLVPVMQKITPAWRDFNEALGKAIGGMIEFGGKLCRRVRIAAGCDRRIAREGQRRDRDDHGQTERGEQYPTDPPGAIRFHLRL